MFWFDNENISIVFSEKFNGDMLFKKDNLELNQKNRQNRVSFFYKNNINPQRLVNQSGTHGTEINTITRDSALGSGALDSSTRLPNTDGLISNIKNSYLMVTGADCFPVFFYDPLKTQLAQPIAAGKAF